MRTINHACDELGVGPGDKFSSTKLATISAYIGILTWTQPPLRKLLPCIGSDNSQLEPAFTSKSNLNLSTTVIPGRFSRRSCVRLLSGSWSQPSSDQFRRCFRRVQPLQIVGSVLLYHRCNPVVDTWLERVCQLLQWHCPQSRSRPCRDEICPAFWSDSRRP